MKRTNITQGKDKKAFLVPLLAAVLIACAALALLFAIRASQAKAAARPITVSVEKEQAMAPPALDTLLANNDLYTIQSVYTVQDVSQQPLTGNTVSAEQAAESAVRHLEQVYGVEISGTVFVEYYKYEGMRTGQIDVYADGPSKEEAHFGCYIDAVTGEVLGSSRMALPSERQERKEGEDPFAQVDEQMMEGLRYDLEFMKRAEELIRTYYLGDRQLVEMQLDGIQWVFSNTDYKVQVDCKVHVEPGESYVINFGYPGYQVVGFSAYPLGWHSALWGYRYADEADEYPSLDGSPALPEENGLILYDYLPDIRVTDIDKEKWLLTIALENAQPDVLKALLEETTCNVEMHFSYAEGDARAVLFNLKDVAAGQTVFTDVPIPPLETMPEEFGLGWRGDNGMMKEALYKYYNGQIVPAWEVPSVYPTPRPTPK